MSAHLGEERVQAIDKLGPPRLEEIDRGVFAYIQPDGTWWINNTGFVAGADGVVAVDSLRHRAAHPGVPRRRRRASSSQPVRTSSTPTTTATTPTATT